MGDGGGRERDALTHLPAYVPVPRSDLRHRGTAVLAVAGCVALWVSRRPEQLSRPYVWAEESLVLSDYLHNGWSAALQPVNGSLNLPAPVLITASAASGLTHTATVEAGLAVAVFALTAAILIVPDSVWGPFGARVAMAAGMAVCPTDPEVFGVVLYSFWWASLWPLIVLGWTGAHWAARVPLLTVAALSSPAAGALFVLFAIRARWKRGPADLLSAGILAAGLVAEILIATTSGRAGQTTHDPLDVLQQMGRTFGVFVMPWTFGGERHWTLLMLAGFALTGIIVLVCVRAPSPGQGTAILLAGGALLYAGVSALPAALISDPRDAGPRYYVLPFTATLWLLIHLAGSVVRSARERLVLGIAALSAVLGVLPVWHRAERHRYVELDWTAQVERCADADERVVDLPVFFDGSRRFFVPKLLLTPAECRAHS